MRTQLLKSIPLYSSDFRFEPELTIKLAKRDARIYEVPVSYSGRTYAEGRKINWRDGFRALSAIARFAFSDSIYTREEYGSDILARLSRAPRFKRWMARPRRAAHVLRAPGDDAAQGRSVLGRTAALHAHARGAPPMDRAMVRARSLSPDRRSDGRALR